jgi:excisionase family DNA binding protein
VIAEASFAKNDKEVRFCSVMEDFLTVDDLIKTLRVSRVWIYKLVREKRIPFYHIEKCIRFSPSEIQEWLKERQNKEWHRDKN